MRPSLEDVVFLHTVATQEFGGHEDTRSKDALESAVARPCGASFGTLPLALREGAYPPRVANPQPPVRGREQEDGDVRFRVLLARLGYEFVARQDEVENFAVEVAEGRYTTQEMAEWFRDHATEP